MTNLINITQITVNNYREAFYKNKGFIDYEVKIQLNSSKTMVLYKRFTEFVLLNSSMALFLSNEFSRELLNTLPRKQYFVSFNNTNLVRDRMLKFEIYLNKLVKHIQTNNKTVEDGCIQLLQKFLDIADKKNVNNNSSELKKNFSEEIMNIKDEINNIKNKINNKEPETNKDILKAESKLLKLKNSNAISDSISNLEKHRRKDIIQESINEVNSLKDSPTTRNRSNRLVFGRNNTNAKAKETKETKLLNNEQILRLQTDKMSTQDQNIDDIIKIVRRQKEIGHVINKELSLQNELLNNVSNEVDRTEVLLSTNVSRIKKL